MKAQVISLTESNYLQETSGRLCLLDFYADWCGPCRKQSPILEELAAVLGDKALIGKIDVDKAPNLARKFGVKSIPTLVTMRNSQQIKRFVGFQDLSTLKDALRHE